MSFFKIPTNFKQNSFLPRSHLLIFIFFLFILSISQVTFSQENEFTEANGWRRHPNGGGLVHKNAKVSPLAYIGSDAKIYGGTINKDADIRGRAIVRGGIIKKGNIYGDAVIRGGIIEDGTIAGNAEVRGGKVSGGDINGGIIFDGRIEGGRIDGDVEVKGGTIKGGYIYGNAKIEGGIIEDGVIGGNAEITGGTIKDGHIVGHVKVSDGIIENGRFDGDAEVSGGIIKGGYIHGDAKVEGGIISGEDTDIFGGTISGNAEVNGGVVYGRADVRGRVSGNARVSGGIIYESADVSGGRVSGNAEVRGQVTGGRVDGNAVIPKGTLVREGMHINDDKLLSRSQKMKRHILKKFRWATGLLGAGTIINKLLTEGVQAATDQTGEVIHDTLGGINLSNSDLPVEDYLQNLKTASQHLDPNKIFSAERQHLSNELRTVYTDIQTDESLTDEEKEQYLKTIAEIQDIVQPPSPPRRPPNGKNKKSTGTR